MTSTNTASAPSEADKITEQFSKQASLANCENTQKMAATKASAFPSSMASHKIGEMTANLGAATAGARAFGRELTNADGAGSKAVADTEDKSGKKVLISVASLQSLKSSS